MAQRFIIDINVNGGKGAGSGEGSSPTGALAGAGAVSALTKNQTAINRMELNAEDRFNQGVVDKGFGPIGAVVDKTTMIRQGLFRSQWSANMQWPTEAGAIKSQSHDFKSFQGSKAQGIWQNNNQAIKTAGIASAWKIANTSVELKNYTSGDSYANAQRNNAMKMASYGAAIAATGFNPVVIGAIVVNEAFSAYTEGVKYNYDRKLERGEITNIKQIAGDISYGKGRGGR